MHLADALARVLTVGRPPHTLCAAKDMMKLPLLTVDPDRKARIRLKGRISIAIRIAIEVLLKP